MYTNVLEEMVADVLFMFLSMWTWITSGFCSLLSKVENPDWEKSKSTSLLSGSHLDFDERDAEMQEMSEFTLSARQERIHWQDFMNLDFPLLNQVGMTYH